jgi:hypothetical protein
VKKMQFLVIVLLAIVSFVSAGTIAAGDMGKGVNGTTTGNCGGNCPGGKCHLYMKHYI